ncbi:hypothetical protein M8C21_007162 [Ambrosia artemisiifolia]|uniref:Uncharacterized protein n=1 Tax=Ambrosia artemisiifolia TaxID=4212 RepID=A0AAD5D747_AMBAR|nr:hypothetical protein M8C21_007162 [Ambrosia artemisiifolia]
MKGQSSGMYNIGTGLS